MISIIESYLLDMIKNWKYKANDNDQLDETKIVSLLEKSSVENCTQGNKIYFYEEITKDTIFGLNKQIDELSKQMKIIQFTYNFLKPPHIEIHICSDGGDIFAALASVDKIMNSEIPIHTHCEGVVASAGTLLSVCGLERFITKNSCMLLHQISGNFWGNFENIKDEHSNFSSIMKIIKNIYLKKTRFKTKELDDLLKHDLYLEADTCLKFGLVDKIL